MPVKCYQDLVVWQKAMRLAREAYLIAKKLPYEEKFALSDQLRRSAVSIPSNIAEGHARGSDKEFVHFLYIARGSNAELMTQLILCVDFGYLTDVDVRRVKLQSNEVGRLLNALIAKLRKKQLSI
ncbi:four helix bundle protein [Megasphaera sp.]|jgi:four helix bundle protein|uniref:four helix bundle protein n=1 Tax=Megasphaera sp. TaxID=2023260 RepID=UPI0035224177